jgi:uncharacterized RDD family membrane protein YckC
VPAGPAAQKAEAQPLVGDSTLAGMGDRAIATVLDSIAIAAIFPLAGMWAAVRWGGVTANGFQVQGTAAVIAFLIVGIAGFLFWWVLEGIAGATLGKLMMNVPVRRVDGGSIGFGKSLIRNLLWVIDAIGLYLVGFLIAILSRLRQRLGDHVAGTVVVRANAGKALRVFATVIWAAFVLACFIGAYRLHAGVPQSQIILNDTAASQPVSSRSTPAAQAIPASSEPRVARAEMGTDRTDDYQIIGPWTEFYTDTPKIVCVWAVEGVDLGVPIRSVWIAEDVGDAAPPDYQLEDKSIDGVNEGSFYITTPANGWPVGKYRLEIYIGDKLAKQIPFTIKQR